MKTFESYDKVIEAFAKIKEKAKNLGLTVEPDGKGKDKFIHTSAAGHYSRYKDVNSNVTVIKQSENTFYISLYLTEVKKENDTVKTVVKYNGCLPVHEPDNFYEFIYNLLVK